MKKKNKNPEALKLKGIKSIGIKLIVTIVIMNLVILTTIGLVSILSMRASVKEDSINSLSHITTLINNTVELKVLGEKKTLEKLSDFPGLNSMDFNKQQTILKSMVENYEYLNMAIANKKGMAKFADGNEYDLSEREYIKKALAGETVISDVIVGKDGSVVFMYATPLKKDDQIVGVLVAVQDGYELSEIVESIEPSENGYVSATNNQGIMVGHRRREFITEQYNPIEASKTNNDLVSLANAFNVILSKKEGIADYKFEGRHMNVAFEPVEGTVWYIVAASPDADFLAGINRIQTMLIILFIGALIISVIIALILGNRISAPIKIINKAIDKLANYNLDTSEEREQAKKWANNKDEIGQMLRSIKLMVNNLKSIVENISSHASSTSTTAKELTTTARNTKESAREVASAVNNIAQGATGQAHDTTVAAQNIEENSKSINEMMNILKELKIATENIDNKKDEGKTALNGLAKLSEENKEEAGIINQIINETNESAENISKASEMIQSIADQTNLLALNAAIEAARAGEAGKGFAVVADEIRKLAEDSTKFTEEIRIIINELREKVGIAVTRMERAAEIVEKSDAQNKITKNKFDAIEDAVEKSKTIVNHIHESSRSIEENNTQIIGIIQNLSAIAEENAATTEEASASVDTQTQSINDISSASDNLSDIASELQDEVSNFKL